MKSDDTDEDQCPQHGVALVEGCDWCRLVLAIRPIAALYDEEETL